MSHFLSTEHQNKDVLVNVYQNIDKITLDEKVSDIFISSGYKVKQSSAEQITYEKGNYTVRILLGAFVKYYKFTVNTAVESNHVRLSIVRATTGMSGGVIGMNQVKKEQGRLSVELQKI
ncbi:MAG: hypothetical protein K0U54_01140 [Bacteroidetes bacterium]|nr:hypothetical protein [Bacteroidota bacterium]